MSEKKDRPVAAPPPAISAGRKVAPPPPSPAGRVQAMTRGPLQAAKPPLPPPQGCESDSEDEDFLGAIVRAAESRKGTAQERGAPSRKGLVLARDADGFERLMDARLVSEEAIVIRTGKQVKCPGCGDWFSEEKNTCPTCFRENWQGAGGAHRKRRRALTALLAATSAIVAGVLIYFLRSFDVEFVLPLEFKIFLWVAAPFVLAAVMVWLRKQAMT